MVIVLTVQLPLVNGLLFVDGLLTHQFVAEM
jgi:hypothetical protein